MLTYLCLHFLSLRLKSTALEGTLNDSSTVVANKWQMMH
jgi:hypothetical protein